MPTTNILPRRDFLQCVAGLSALCAFPGVSAAAAGTRDAVIADLVTANHILTAQGIVDGFGHISRRDPERKDRFLMSRSRAPGMIEPDDIMDFDIAGTPIDARGRSVYIERFIHAAIYAARPDVHSVIHEHSKGLLPFTVTNRPLRPLTAAGAAFGQEVPVWNIHDKFPDSKNVAVTRLDIGEDLARKLGSGPAVLMRGHGVAIAGPSIRVAVFLAIMLENEAKVSIEALQLGDLDYRPLAEITATQRTLNAPEIPESVNRLWEDWCRTAGRPFTAQGY